VQVTLEMKSLSSAGSGIGGAGSVMGQSRGGSGGGTRGGTSGGGGGGSAVGRGGGGGGGAGSVQGLMVQVGQCAAQVCMEVHRLERRLGLSSRLADVVAHERHQLSHSNNVYFSSDVDFIMDQVRCQLEAIDIPKEICIVADSCGANGIIGTLSDELAYACAGMSLNSFALNINGYNGLGVYSAVNNIQRLLENCDSLCLRNYSDARYFLEQEHITDYDTASVGAVIAADIVVGLNLDISELPFDYSLFPKNVCTSRSRLYDVRSSLWKALQSRHSTKKYSSMRSLANNIRSVHSLHHFADNSDSKLFMSSASIVSAQLHVKQKSLTATSCKHTSAEIDAALRWATPGFRWPRMGMKQTRNNPTGLMSANDDASVTSDSASRCSTSAVSRSGMSVAISSASSQNLSSRDGASSYLSSVTTKPDILTELDVTAMSFLSPYSLQDFEDLLAMSLKQLKAGAYNSRFRIFYFSFA
jgi:hypothetical protein